MTNIFKIFKSKPFGLFVLVRWNKRILSVEYHLILHLIEESWGHGGCLVSVFIQRTSRFALPAWIHHSIFLAYTAQECALPTQCLVRCTSCHGTLGFTSSSSGLVVGLSYFSVTVNEESCMKVRILWTKLEICTTWTLSWTCTRKFLLRSYLVCVWWTCVRHGYD